MSSPEIENSDLKTTFIVLSNLAFLAPAILCLVLKKHVQAFVFMSIFFTSSLYHACKSDYETASSSISGRFCFLVGYEEYFVLDHLFATLSIPCIFLSFTPLDVVLFSKIEINNNEDDDGKKRIPSTFYARDKKEIKNYILDIYFTPTIGSSSSLNGLEDAENVRRVMYLEKNYVLKPNAVGLETLYVCVYAYLIGICLLISYPNTTFSASVTVSGLIVACSLGAYYYLKFGMIVYFDTVGFCFGLLLSVIAVILILIQDHISNETYWLTHSVWHVCAALGQFFLLKSKYRYLIER
jgi:hypothetical protein